jgi:hypothetical protein
MALDPKKLDELVNAADAMCARFDSLKARRDSTKDLGPKDPKEIERLLDKRGKADANTTEDTPENIARAGMHGVQIAKNPHSKETAAKEELSRYYGPKGVKAGMKAFQEKRANGPTGSFF